MTTILHFLFVVFAYIFMLERTYLGDNHSKILLVQSERRRVSKIKLHSQEIMLAQVGSPLAIEKAHRNLQPQFIGYGR